MDPTLGLILLGDLTPCLIILGIDVRGAPVALEFSVMTAFSLKEEFSVLN